MNWPMIAAAAGAMASAIIVIAVLWKALAFLGKMSRLQPVILEMADQFRTDTGSSLKDQMNRLEKLAVLATDVAKDAKEVATTAKAAAIIQTALLETIRTEIARQGTVKG